MGLFNKGICPICNENTSMLTKSTLKYNNDYICQNCLSKLLNSKVFITKIKNMQIDELRNFVENYEVVKENEKIERDIKKANARKLCEEKKAKLKQEHEKQKIIKQQNHEKNMNTIRSYQNGKKIKQVMILNTVNDSRKSFSSSVIKGTVGNFALGPIGAISGAVSGKNKISSKTTFLVEYMNGSKETKTVDNNSKEYKELSKYIKF